MRIVRLQAENVKRLKAVDITPKGDVTVIGGKNGAGKSSVLDCIAYALGGKAAVCDQPVRTGEKSAKIVLTLDDLIVTRTFTADGGSTLVVTSRDGKSKMLSPQAIATSLTGKLGFDPLAFQRMSPLEQRETLRRLVDLDFSALDAERKGLFDERAQAGRDVHGRQTQIDALPHFPEAPKAEVSVADLSKELAAAQEQNQKRDSLAAMVAAKKNSFAVLARAVDRAHADLAEAEQRVAKIKADLISLEGQGNDADAELTQAEAALAAEPVAATAPILSKIEAADATNKQVRANQTRATMQQAFAEAKTEFDRLTDQISAIDADKAKQLAEAKFPVPGLSFSDDGVLMNGLSLKQASSAEQLRVSVAIGIALNPKLKEVLVYDGSLLDEDSFAAVKEMVEAAGVGTWIEIVTDDPARASVIIEDGMVRPDKAVQA